MTKNENIVNEGLKMAREELEFKQLLRNAMRKADEMRLPYEVLRGLKIALDAMERL